MNYQHLLYKYDDMKLYSIAVTLEYVEEMAADIGNAMEINIDANKIKEAFQCKQAIGRDRICYFDNEEDNRCFILVDCRDTDYIYSIIVRCKNTNSQIVKNILLKWDKICREENGQVISIDLPDWMHDNTYDEKFNPLINCLKINKLID